MANLDATQTEAVFRPKPSQPPPPNTVGIVGWLRTNLFSGVFSTLLTLFCVYVIVSLTLFMWEWAVTNAVWSANSHRECLDITKGQGACWAGVGHWMNGFMYGRYPDELQWRVDLAGILVVLWIAPFWMPRVTGKIAIAGTAVLVYPFLAGHLFAGGEAGLFLSLMVGLGVGTFAFNSIHVLLCLATGRGIGGWILKLTGFDRKHDSVQKYPLMAVFAAMWIAGFIYQSTWEMPDVSTNLWGGLFLTLVISSIGVASSLPTGIVLALGRRSQMPIIRVACTLFIELFRSVPLITILFMSVTMMPLFLPEGTTLVKLVQAIIGVCIFAAAYSAENIRGGLQSIPKGQYEAAQALGLNYWKMMTFIIMPQALKLMIPNIVGSFIGLFKDTTLVSIIGLYDLLLMLKAVSANPQWNGLHKEPLVFGASVFFVLCFAMSKYSQYLERTLGQGTGRR